MMDHRDTIRTLAEAVRLALGDLSAPKRITTANAVFARQCRGLIAADGAYAAAVREEATARVAAIWPDPEMAEKVMTDPDPDHAFWLLTTPDGLLRHFGGRKVDPNAGGMTLGGIMGRVVFGPPPGDEESSG